MLVLRKRGRTETSACVAFTFTLSCTLVSGIALPFVWVTPGLVDLAVLVTIGLLGGVAQILMTTAFKHGDLAVVAPLEYTAMIWATLFGRSEEHTSELQSLMRISYAVFCLKKKNKYTTRTQ